MHIKLNTWQTFALFLPFIAGFVLLNIQTPAKDNPQTNFALANFLLVLGFTIVFCYQALLALDFTRRRGIKSILFKLNALVPPFYFILYLLYVIYFTFISPKYYSHKYNTGPMPKATFGLSAWIMAIFLVHAFITFYFINNQFVARKIKAVADVDEQEQLRTVFLLPMKRLTKASVWLIALFMLLTTFIDLITFKNSH